MTRAINFSAGPSTLPLPALEHAQREFLDHEGTGMSIIEHSHRGKAYAAVHAECKALLAELLNVPDTHEVLFMQGGATGQFALIPMNLAAGKTADYIDTGAWSVKAIKEAKIVASAREAGTGKVDGRYIRVPGQSELDLDANAAYVHITSNNTIAGTQYHAYPDTGDVPLIADMSSDILCRPIDVSKFGMIYAGAQKNLGPSGITILILRKDLLERVPDTIANIFRYTTISKGDSLQNTIPVFPVYMVRNVLRWVKEMGGAEAMKTRNEAKAKVLYDAIDASPEFFKAAVEKDSRSLMNVTFNLPTEDLEKAFVAKAEEAGIFGVKGHRSVGGIRASIYNACDPKWVDALVSFMGDFKAANG